MPTTGRLLALCAAASIATLGSTGAASADPSGFIALGGGPLLAQFDFGSGSTYSQSGYAARGLVSGALAITPVLGVQGDVLLGLDHLEGEFDDAVDRSTLDVAAHGFYRDPERFLAGTFVQLGRDAVSNGFVEEGRERAYLGGEGQVYLGDFTLYGQGGLQWVAYPDIPDFDESGWFGNLEARYFLTPDLRIDAHAGLSMLARHSDYELETTVLNLGVGAEYRLANMPASVFAAFDCFSLSYAPIGDFAMDQQRVLVGIKFGIGEQTLKDRDRNGASLKPVESLGVSLFPG